MVSQMTVKETLHVFGIRWCMMVINFVVTLYGNIDDKILSDWLENPEEGNKAEEYFLFLNW